MAVTFLSADDIILLSASISGLPNLLKCCFDVSHELRLTLLGSKCNLVIDDTKLENETITWCKRFNSVVRATPQVNGRVQNYPSHQSQTHAPQPTVTKYCIRNYVHHICSHAAFGQDRAGGFLSPYSIARVTTKFFRYIDIANVSVRPSVCPFVRPLRSGIL